MTAKYPITPSMRSVVYNFRVLNPKSPKPVKPVKPLSPWTKKLSTPPAPLLIFPQCLFSWAGVAVLHPNIDK